MKDFKARIPNSLGVRMPGANRLKVKGEIAHYHIMSRTVGQQFLLGDTEKEILVQIIRYFSRMYFIKMNAYCIMSNHFHLVIRSLPNRMYSDKEVISRIHTLYLPIPVFKRLPANHPSASSKGDFCLNFPEKEFIYYGKFQNIEVSWGFWLKISVFIIKLKYA